MSGMTPQEIVHELDKFIVGQANAKRAVAIALRNRWRRQQVAEPLRQEITPKNILMIGPTGVGKTEIARRLARLADAPFIKVEATKFTEVGYVGRDVDSIVRDLVEISVKQTREQAMRLVRTRAQDAAEDRILDVLVGSRTGDAESATRQNFRKKLREGELDDKEIDIEVSIAQPQMEILAPPGMEDLTSQIQGMLSNLGGGRKRLRRMKVREAFQVLTDEEAARLATALAFVVAALAWLGRILRPESAEVRHIVSADFAIALLDFVFCLRPMGGFFTLGPAGLFPKRVGAFSDAVFAIVIAMLATGVFAMLLL